MKRFLLLFLLVFQQFADAQPFLTGHRSVTFYDASRLARPVTAELYYPGAAAGNNVVVVPGTTKFPVVCFGHGFLTAATTYLWLADSLVKNGYIVLLPTTEASAFPSQPQLGLDMAFLCSTIIAQNDSATSFLYGRVLKRSAVGGHSMGGGCSFLAMTYNASINAIFNYAAAETIPSAKNAATTIQKPGLFLAGSLDCIVPDSNELRMYNNIPYPCKTYVNFTGGLHCHFCRNDFGCVIGQQTSGCFTSTLTYQVVEQKTIALLVPFLNYYLKDSCNSKSIFETVYNNMTGVTKQRVCTADPLGCTEYTFIGDGNWNVASNWYNNLVPPATLPANGKIIINPVINGECVVNINQVISPGASITVISGKKMRVPGKLDIL